MSSAKKSKVVESKVVEKVEKVEKVEAKPVKKVAKKEESKEEPKVEKPKEKKKKAESTDSALVSQLAASAVGVSEVDDKVRRVVNNEEVEKSFDELHASLEKELQALREDKTHTVGVRTLRSLCRSVKSLKADCFRLLSRKVRKPSTRNGNSGFMKSVKISPEMAKFCGFKSDQLVSRVDVTKAICNYVKEKNLQNPADRRQFNPDDKLATLLEVKDTITYYTLQKHIQKHFPKTL